MKIEANWPTAIVAVCALVGAIINGCNGSKHERALEYFHGADYNQSAVAGEKQAADEQKGLKQ